MECVSFILHKSINYNNIYTFNGNNVQLLGIQITNFKKPINIYNIYCGHRKIDPNFWKNYIFSKDTGLVFR